MSATAEEFDEGFDEGEEGGLSGFYVLAIFLALLAAFLVIVYFAYQQGVANGMARDRDLPVVAADPRPVREEVELATADDRRREVYDRLEGVAPTNVVAEADPARDPLEGYAQDRPEGAAGAPGRNGSAASSSRSESATAAPRQEEPVTSAPLPTQKPAPEASEAETAAAPARAEITREPAPAQASAPAPVEGTHVVQVGAFGSDDEAMRFYNTLSGRLGSLVTGKKPDIQRAEVNGRTYHRLRLAPFTSKSAADSYCGQLKAKGQDCLVRSV